MKLLEQALQLAYKGTCSDEIKPITTPEVKALGDQLKILHKIMRGPQVGIALVTLQRAGFFEYLIPEIKESLDLKSSKRFKEIWPHTVKVVSQTPPVTILRWAALFHDMGKARAFSIKNDKVTFHGHEKMSAGMFNQFSKRAKIFSPRQRSRIYFLVSNLGHVESYTSEWTDSAVRRFGKDVGNHLEDLLILSSADITTKNQNKREMILRNIDELRNRVLNVREMDSKGNSLPKGLGNIIAKEFNIPFGPKIGDIRKKLEDKVESHELSGNEDFQYYIEHLKKNEVEFNISEYSSIQLMG